MKFSICIPNYNYGRYIGRAIQSVLDQNDPDIEILISDNASTDDSVEVIRSYADPRIRLQINACNVGFAGNLDRVARLATGDQMIMLSSDDALLPGALATYRQLQERLGEGADRSIVSSTWAVIDSQDAVTGEIGPPSHIWLQSDLNKELYGVVGGPIYEIDCGELLRRTLLTMNNPFNFSATAFPRKLYCAVEGYGGGRLINPDKWFHWKLMGVADNAYFIDRQLVGYRWHDTNQTAQQLGTGALKYSVDEYVSTLEVDQRWLTRAGLTRQQMIEAFIEYDVARHGLATLAMGQRSRARRILTFGKAVYPEVVRQNRKAKALKVLLGLGPVGQQIAQRAYKSYLRKNQPKNGMNEL